MRGGERKGAGRKPGSPNKEKKMDAKNSVVRVRLSDEEKTNISDCLKFNGKTESEFIRDAIAKEISSKNVLSRWSWGSLARRPDNY